jgi:hypothetical protein
MAELRAYLAAHYKEDAAGPPTAGDWTVEVVAQAPAGWPPSAGRTPYRPEAEAGSFQGERIDEGPEGFAIVDAETGVATRWRPERRHVEVVPGPASGTYELVQSAYAAVRTLTHHTLARAGDTVVMHAGAVAVDGRGVLLMGCKGAGKTTLSTALMQRGAAYLASDRVFAWRAGNGWRAAGWMSSYRVRLDGAEVLFGAETAARMRAFADARREEPEYWHGGKFRFPPQDLLRTCGWAPAREAPLGWLVLMEDAGQVSAGVEALDPARAAEALRGHTVAYQGIEGIEVPAPTGRETEQLAADVRAVRLRGREAPGRMAGALLDWFRGATHG